jgi:hypothetical protein
VVAVTADLRQVARPDAIIRRPSPETRAAAGLHPVRHSVGLVLVADRDPGADEASFEVGADGTVAELAGWGHAGRTVEVVASLTNPPANPLAVHTVAVEDDSVAVLTGLQALVAEHSERYGACQVFVPASLPRAVVNWVAAGCPDPAEQAVPSDEALAEANSVEYPPPTSASDHRRDGTNVDFETSEPVTDEQSAYPGQDPEPAHRHP